MLRSFYVHFYKQSKIFRTHLKKMDNAKRPGLNIQQIPEILHAPGICIVRPPKVTGSCVAQVPVTDNMESIDSSRFSLCDTKDLEDNVQIQPGECTLTSSLLSHLSGSSENLESPVDMNSEGSSSVKCLENLIVSDSLGNEKNANLKDNSEEMGEWGEKVEPSASSLSAEDSVQQNKPLQCFVTDTNDCCQEKDKLTSTGTNCVYAGLPKKSMLNSGVLEDVTSFVKEKLNSNPSEIIRVEKVDTEDAVPGDNLDCSVADTCSCDSDTYDISPLFSESFEKSYQAYRKGAEKKAKKRKYENEQQSPSVKKEKRRRRAPPNYFLALQISNPIIHQNVETVQKYMLDAHRDLQKALISVPTLHLTLMVMHLASKEDIAKAVDVLDGCQPFVEKWMHDAQLLELSGIGHFKDEVVFVKIPDEKQLHWLQKLAEHLTSVFQENGIPPSDNKGFKPHCTILKLSKAPQLRKKGVKKVTSKYYEPYKDSLFGSQAVETIQLCSMLKPKDPKGYYHIEHRIPCNGTALDGAALSARESSLLTLHKFPASHTQGSSIHTTAVDNRITTVAFEREIKWIFVEGDKL